MPKKMKIRRKIKKDNIPQDEKRKECLIFGEKGREREQKRERNKCVKEEERRRRKKMKPQSVMIQQTLYFYSDKTKLYLFQL